MDAIVSCKQPEYRPSLRPAAVLYKNTPTVQPKKKGRKEGTLKKRNRRWKTTKDKRKNNQQTKEQKRKFMELFSNEMKRNPHTDRKTDIKLNTD